MNKDSKMQLFDLRVTIVLFIIACFVRKVVLDSFSDSWLAFNDPAIGILLFGELLWLFIRKKLIKK